MRLGLALGLGMMSGGASAPLAISPTSVSLSSFASQTFSASGGVAPYTFSVTAGAATGSFVGSSSGVFYAGSKSGSVTVRVTDSAAATADATITVTQLASASLWLRADLGLTGSPVSAWADQVGAVAAFSASGTAKPTIQATAIGGRQALRGDGSLTKMTSASNYTAWTVTNAGTTCIVGNYLGAVASQSPEYNDPQLIGGDSGWFQIGACATKVVANAGDSGGQKTTTVTRTSGTPFYAVLQWDGAHLTLRVNGSPAASPPAIGNISGPDGSTNLFAGYNVGPSTVFAQADIAEVYGANAVLTGPQVAAWEATMAAYYGI